ncbi:MAG: hypothetical protein ACHQ49_08180 [Elusimicrobiota bacterium]
MSSPVLPRPIVRICDTCAEAEDLILRLQNSEGVLDALSIAGRIPRRDGLVTGCYSSGPRMKFWGLMSSFWGGVWGIFSGSAYFEIPGIGAVVIAGPLAAEIAGALERSDAADGLSVLGAGLRALEVPANVAGECEQALRDDKLLLIANGAAASAEARRILLDMGVFVAGAGVTACVEG